VSSVRNVRSSGLIAINLDDDDELGWVKMTRGKEDLIIVSETGPGHPLCRRGRAPDGTRQRRA
jgi:DNA gyrase/topoisomerase IV subunit A